MDGAEQQYQKQMQAQMKKQQDEEMKQSLMSQILSPQARERLVKIKLVKPEKVAQIEAALIQAAQSGKLRNRVSEQDLISMLESQSTTETKFKRRGIDDEW